MSVMSKEDVERGKKVHWAGGDPHELAAKSICTVVV